MNRFCIVALLAFFTSLPAWAADAPKAPATVQELWADFDPRQDPLDAQVVREWEQDGIVYRYVTYHIGTFKEKPARMAAFFAFPKGETKLPGLLQIHGGGQRASLKEVEFFAKRGYACLSINWGGREMENAKDGDPNTDWGAVHPTQQNVPGYYNLKPGDKYLDPFDSPRNNNWYLLTLGARRGLTFLEQQPEVDPERLGVYGHSMGGNLTIYVAGCDARVKAASPSVGGSGFRTESWPLLPQYKPQVPHGDLTLFNATLGFESYASHIKAPLLWLGATNDFHGIMDDTYRTSALIPHKNVRFSFTPHMNHRFTSEFAVTRPLWFDQYLKASFTFPTTPASKLTLATDDHVPELQITPDASQPVAAVHIYYSIDPDPRARFWRSAEATKSGTTWTGKLPILNIDQPLFAFANVIYPMKKGPSEPFGRPTEQYAISSAFHTAAPRELQLAKVVATDKASSLIDDFAHGWQDWYLLEAGNPHHWEYSTRKVSDPKWQGELGQQLALDVQSEKPNELVFVLTENFFRSYRGKSLEFAAAVKLDGGNAVQTVSLSPKDFKASDGDLLSSWKNVDLLSVRAYHEKGSQLIGSKNWQGPLPVFRQLRWQSALADERTATEQIDKLKKLGARITFDDQHRVIAINLGERRVTDADLVNMKGLEHLQELDLTRTRITGAGLTHLQDLTTLRKLFLTDTKIDDAAMAHLKGLKNLGFIGLSGTPIGDEGLIPLANLTGLKQLFCLGTNVTDAGAEKLRRALPQCEVTR